ncbi:GIY-YIG nuclease family protein [Methylocystis echinoides]|uniref:Bacteriophage T5 Orf172 DNA-binding domain-containing protein n=1 Tax=Methylocystis echinoides TaxID=29468 RepID=A0A9W6GTP3_9HYPH|nr:GIY-YIG nuclease family protein [Methylocystis echinoides]GLI92748.1 hypothetical protein LMG27198_17400 [Methylocystis echinoides]
MAEIVYVLINEAMPGLVKIGMTTSDLGQRIRSLYTSGVPLAFELFFACEVANAAFVEKQLHEAFGDHRVSKSREFFRIAPERVKAALLIATLKEVKLNDAEIFETPEQKTEVELAKRRARFTFAMIGVQPGTELQLEKDNNVTCKTVDDKNRVEFNGDTTSLSDAALQALKAAGYNWPTASGPWEWTYKGKRLDEIRREIEESAD